MWQAVRSTANGYDAVLLALQRLAECAVQKVVYENGLEAALLNQFVLQRLHRERAKAHSLLSPISPAYQSSFGPTSFPDRCLSADRLGLEELVSFR